MIPALSPVGGPTTPPFSPDDISGLVAWFDASDSSTVHIDGSGTEFWDSRVGSFSVQQTAGANCPTVSSGALNGLDVLSANGSQYMSFGAGLLNSVSAWSIFAVVKPTQVTNAAVPVMIMTNTSPNGRAFFFTTAASAVWEGAGRRLGSDSASVTLSSTAVSNNTWKYVSLISSYTATTQTLYLNGSQIKQNTSWCTSGNTDATGGDLTIFTNAAVNLNWTGSIAEILIYNSALGTTDQQSVEAYLASKWGL